jgi:hypothetical protein
MNIIIRIIRIIGKEKISKIIKKKWKKFLLNKNIFNKNSLIIIKLIRP